MADGDNRELNTERAKAVGYAIARCTSAMGGADAKTGETSIFSGVFAKFRGNPLLVTAAHCLETLALPTLRVLSSNKHIAGSAPNLRGGRGHRDTETLDVAFLELEAGAAEDLSPDFVSEVRMSSESLRIGDVVCLRGYPTEMARVDGEGGEEPAVVRRDCVFVTHVESFGTDERPHDIVLRYNDSECFDILTGERVTPPHARGMSGCGAFSLGEMTDGVLWSPDQVSLVGIQSRALFGVHGRLVVRRIELATDLMGSYFTS